MAFVIPQSAAALLGPAPAADRVPPIAAAELERRRQWGRTWAQVARDAASVSRANRDGS